MYLIITLAIVIIAALSYYAGTLIWKVREKNRLTDFEKNKRVNYITDSISHIAKAMQAEQCELSEGVLRIWVLLDHYNKEQTVPKSYQDLYPGYFSLYDVIKDMPTHDARKKLSKQDVLKLDLKRLDAEDNFKEQIIIDTASILSEFTINHNTPESS